MRPLSALTFVAAGAAGGLGVAASRWKRTTTEAAQGLAPVLPEIMVRDDDFAGLPAAVETYLRRALPLGPVPSAVRFWHVGRFRLNGKWRPFRSVEFFGIEPRGFLWDARIRVLPLIDVRVRDASIQGVGSMQAAIAGFVPVANERDTSLLNVGALERYLAEAPWLPVALLPRFGVTWAALDASTAQATLTARTASVAMDFTFDEAGNLTRVYSAARPREVNGHYEPTPWAGRHWNYQKRCGMRIPVESEVEWIVGGTPEPYFRGRLVAVERGVNGGGP